MSARFVTDGPLLLAVPVAAAAGLVSFLSPCVLPLVPGYLSYVAGLTGRSWRRRRPGRPRAEPTAGRRTATLTRPRAADRARRRRCRGRVVAGALLFVLGFTVVFVAYGAAVRHARQHAAPAISAGSSRCSAP